MCVLKIDNKTISTPLLDIIFKIKCELHNNKLATIKPRGLNIRVNCPTHKNGLESTPAADIYIGPSNDKVEYGFFRCFVCGEQGPFYHFVAECFDIDDESAKQWLIDNFADGLIEYELELPKIELNTKKDNVYLDESVLNNFENFHPYMIQRKLSHKVIEEFQIKYDSDQKCLVFPVRDEKGNLVMLTRRSVIDKTFIIDKNKEKPLYALDYILKHNVDKFLITEGQIDCLVAWSYGFPAVASMGAISDSQIQILNKSGVRVLYLMFDNDDSGKRFRDKVISKIRKDIIVIPVDIYQANKKDIGDLTFNEFYDCIEKAEKC